MADEETPKQTAPEDGESAQGERGQLLLTRRDFLIGAGAGVAATAAAAGAVTVLNQPAAPPATPKPVAAPTPAAAPVAPAAKPAQPSAAPAPAGLPLTMRRVTLSINGMTHEVTVDVRESLWETMTRKLGMAGANLGCDRAQCGACAVMVDGRAVNSCTVLSARLGRGQKIVTVEGLASGPGIQGLHPVQRAFWQEGGFQCGICTRGFIASSYALLQVNKSPTREQIREALAGNICRCGEYAKIYDSVEKAAAEMRTGAA